jgi:hypothetical protein
MQTEMSTKRRKPDPRWDKVVYREWLTRELVKGPKTAFDKHRFTLVCGHQEERWARNKPTQRMACRRCEDLKNGLIDPEEQWDPATRMPLRRRKAA